MTAILQTFSYAFLMNVLISIKMSLYFVHKDLIYHIP